MSTSNFCASSREKLERFRAALPPRRKPPSPIPARLRKTLNIWEFLQIDSRPLFIVDRKSATVHLHGDLANNAIIYKNGAFEKLAASIDLEVMVLKLISVDPGPSYYIAGRVWGSCLVADGDFLVCTGNYAPGSEGEEYSNWSHDMPKPVVHRETSRDLKETRERRRPSHQLLDWTRYSANTWLPQHYRLLAAVKWKFSPIDSMTRWSSSLRAIVNSVMVHPYQMVLYWGPKYTVIYNEPYSEVCTNRHPGLLGKQLSAGWPESYAKVRQYLDDTMRGSRFEKLGDVLPVDRADHDEECYFNWVLTPVIEKGGNVGGALWQQNEVTSRVLLARRQQLLKSLRACTAIARCQAGFWAAVLDAFDSNTYDSPFVVLYEIPAGNRNEAVLLGTRGVPTGHIIAPKIRIISDDDHLFASEMREARFTGTRSLKHDLTQHKFMQEIAGRGWQLPCTSAAVIPIHSSDEERRVEAIIVLGINPRRPFDTDYEIWLDQVQQSITAHLAEHRSLETTVQRVMQEKIDDINARRASELSNKLEELTGELRKTELMFSNMASVIPVGLQELDAELRPLYTNDAWHEIMVSPREVDTPRTHIIHAEDMSLYTEHLKKAAAMRELVVLEYRIVRPGNSTRDRNTKWVSANILPIFKKSGDLKGFYVTAMDISILKDAEVTQKERADEAVEANIRQERFIDMTCHELRNPLSAILQSAEFILDHLENPKNIDKMSISESCNTIILCTTHQRRIVDDILITSKLDSDLLPVNPIRLRPASYLRKALKIFDAETKANGIALSVNVDPSYTAYGIGWAAIDPARVLQVLVNLVTNAIKFTADTGPPKRITVSIGASHVEPIAFQTVTFAQPEVQDHSAHLALAGFEGESFYLIISVTDTGIGISEQNQAGLFGRFQQAPKTESKYGGSGLGLYICKNLARLQGGAIGIHSIPNGGSTFSFYVLSKRTRPADNDPEMEMFLTPGSTARSRHLTGPSTSSNNEGGDAKFIEPPHSVVNEEETNIVHGFRILIVEDNLLNQRVLKKQLDSKSCITFTASNGKEAVDFLIKEAGEGNEGGGIEVCLMDCEMPVMNGIQACRTIRDLEVRGSLKRHIPILGVSANVRTEKVQEMRDAGMDDVISKPFRLIDLIEKTAALVRSQRVDEWTAGSIQSLVGREKMTFPKDTLSC